MNRAQMRAVILLILTMIGGLVALSFCWSEASSFMTMKDDTAVFVGLVIMCLIVIGVILLIKVLINEVKTLIKQFSEVKKSKGDKR